jgi:hypothetical protein
MSNEVRINAKAQAVLDGLHKTNPIVADQIEDVLDLLETTPSVCEHEPYPHERGAAFLTQVLGTDWFVVWIYAPSERRVVLVAKIDQLP